MSKTIALAFVLILMLTATQVAFVNNIVVSAQFERGTVPPDAFTKPSEITVFSPSNGTTYENGTLTLSVNVTLPQSSTASSTILYYVAYTSDWAENETVVLYNNKGFSNSIESRISLSGHQYFTGSIEVTNIPDGKHNITITAHAGGFYPADELGFYRFLIDGTSTVFFTIGNPATPTPTPSVPEFSPWTILLLLSIIFSGAGLLVYHKKHKR